MLPRTWKYDPNPESYGKALDGMTGDEATREAANSYAVATVHNNQVVTQKANCMIAEFVSLGLAVFALVLVLTLGD